MRSGVLRCEGGALRLAAQHACSPVVLDAFTELARHAPLIEPMWAQSGPLVLDDAGGDATLAGLVRGLGVRALSLTPLRARGRKLGALVVVHDAPPADETRALLQTLAVLLAQAAVAPNRA